jgi:hypothetical protein
MMRIVAELPERREHMLNQKLKALGIAVVLAGSLAACGGNDVDTVVARLEKGAKDEGMKLDKGCVKKVVEKLSDEDVKTLVEAGEDDDPTLSPEGEAIQPELFSCLDADSFVTAVLDEIPDDGSMDRDCLEKALRGLDSDALSAMATGEGDSSELIEVMTACVTGG